METQEYFTEPITGAKYRHNSKLNNLNIVRTTSGKLEESENLEINIDILMPLG